MKENFTIPKKDGNMISCIKTIPDHSEGIVLAIHGFSSSKEGSTYQMLLERLPSAGFGVVCIDLPGHGTAESARELLRIPGALDSIEAAEGYILREYPGQEVCYFASSFGAYLTGLYISTREHSGRKIFWRSAAVNMPELFYRKNPTEKEIQLRKELDAKGYFDTAMDLHKSVRITKDMYNDLIQNDLFRIFDPNRFGIHRIAMAHGKEDAVIAPAAAERFSSAFRIPITWFPGEGHSLSGESSTPGKVMDLAVLLYKGSPDVNRGDKSGE